MAEAAKREMTTLLETFFDNVNKGDLDAAMHGYTDDCTFMVSGADAIYGKTDVKATFVNALKSGVFGKLKLVEIFYLELITETTAYANTYYNSCDENGKVLTKYKDALLWKKVGGKWLVDRDTLNPC